MTADIDTLSTPRPAAPPAVQAWLKTFYWSVRRELWEHPSVWMAPLAVAGLALVGFVLGSLTLPHRMHATHPLTAKQLEALTAIPFVFVAAAVMLTGLVVAIFYCTGALHGERRDRSILFWKSLPVSDVTTVLSKAAIPLVVLPVVTLVVATVAQLLMLAWGAAAVLAGGGDLATWWTQVPLVKLLPMLAEGTPYLAAWYAPVFGWLILVSAWAKRAPFLWAVAAPLALGLVEQLALSSHEVWKWLGLRVFGAFAGAMGPFGHAGMLAGVQEAGWASPHVWIGLALAAGFLAGSVWLRRSRDPI